MFAASLLLAPDMESKKALAYPGYLLAFMLFMIPLFDGITAVLPLRPSQERWRFGAVGALSNMTLVPLLGIFIALALAVYLDHQRVRRVLGWLCALFAVILTAMAASFVLDFFQTRIQVLPKFHTMVDAAAGTSLMKQAFTIVTLVLLARSGLGGTRSGRRRGDAPQTPLIPLAGGARGE